MKVFITGVNGFIGSHLAKRMIDEGHTVVGLVKDIIPSEWLTEALKSCVLVRGDIRNISLLKRVLNDYEIECCIHLAAKSIVKLAYRNPIDTFEVNCIGTAKVLEACRQIAVDRVLVQSTDKVYGNQMNATVDSKRIPTEPYGTSKICSDLIAKTYAQNYGMKILITRPCNTYGYDTNNRIIPNTIRSCLRGEAPIIFKNDTSMRQYIYIDDLTSCFAWLICEKTNAGEYLIATEDVKNQEEVVMEILKHFPHLNPKYIEKPEILEIKNQSMEVKTWPPHWEPKVNFEEGIKLTIEKFKKYWNSLE
ncbi:MAG: NAD(P)-dependent oxidoreductase [Thermoplasmatales archaeon]|nr:MAG: NAD(P)-dependent oxidoreductase [Thermoplasmatales archaeon]